MNRIAKISIMSLVSTIVFALPATIFAADVTSSPSMPKSDHKNCEVHGKKIHVKDKAKCEAKKGVFIEATVPAVNSSVTPAVMPSVAPVAPEASGTSSPNPQK